MLRTSSIKPNFDTGGSKFARNSDQTSTPPVSKLRPNFDQPSTKLRPNFGQTSAKPRHPQCRSLVEVCSVYSMKYIMDLIKCLTNCDAKLLPNFDQTSTLGVPKFGRNADQTSTLGGGRSLVGISTKRRHHTVQHLIFHLNK